MPTTTSSSSSAPQNPLLSATIIARPRCSLCRRLLRHARLRPPTLIATPTRQYDRLLTVDVPRWFEDAEQMVDRGKGSVTPILDVLDVRLHSAPVTQSTGPPMQLLPDQPAIVAPLGVRYEHRRRRDRVRGRRRRRCGEGVEDAASLFGVESGERDLHTGFIDDVPEFQQAALDMLRCSVRSNARARRMPRTRI